MKYDANLGIFGNIKVLFKENNKTNIMVYANKSSADINYMSTEDALCEIDPTQKVEDIETATLELDERLIALEEKIKLLENK